MVRRAPGQDVDIVLSQPHGGRSQAEGDALLTLVTQGSLQAAIFRADDLDATFATLRDRGAAVAENGAPHFIARLGAKDLWMAFLRDPDGNLFALMAERAPG